MVKKVTDWVKDNQIILKYKFQFFSRLNLNGLSETDNFAQLPENLIC